MQLVSLTNSVYQILKVTLLIGFLSHANVVLAETQNNTNTSSITPLPLTAAQINKLNKLLHVSHGKNEVPTFSIDQPHEHVVWNQTPIDIVLPVGKERIVTFESAIQFGYDKSVLTDDILKVQNNNHVLYFTAKKAFSAERVEVKENDTGKIILINLSSKNEASTTPLDIAIKKESKSDSNNTSLKLHDLNASPDQALQSAKSSINAISLIRFAAQQLYAPKRLLKQPGNIFRVPMHVPKMLPIFRDKSVIAMPLASWRGNDLFVTAILLRNSLNQMRALDPRELCGNWQAATFFPQNELSPKGNQQDTTTLFVISNRPLSESLHGCLAS